MLTGLEPATSGVTGRHSKPTELQHLKSKWADQGLNLGPLACKANALPTELPAQMGLASLRPLKSIQYETIRQAYSVFF